tara:strand:- start:182 stop:442 length:261 start_codon:yes stop_codon:yes gene_type:complete
MDFSLIWLLTGLLIGFIFGYGVSSICGGSKLSDLDSEIFDLRAQRECLKKEIFRLSEQLKPKKRPYKKKTYKKKPYKKKPNTPNKK